MLSIIICSRNNTPDPQLLDNIEASVGVAYELIFVDNSTNTHSIYSAYNEGITRSNCPYLCFVHDDVQFNTPDWGQKIINHLSNENTGLCGLAGGDAMLRIPFDYGAYNRSMSIVHTDKNGKKPKEIVRMPSDFSRKARPVVLLDGVLICGRRGLFEKIRFDESMDGFHGYDYDISMQSFTAGYTNLVMYDIELEHFSKGKMDASYFKAIRRIYEKWRNYLPVFERHISAEKQKQLIPELEKLRSAKLLKWLVRSGMPLKEIVEYYSYFIQKTDLKTETFMLNFLNIRICLIHLISTLRNKNIN